MMSVKAFGEAEFWFAMIKVATILIFMGVAAGEAKDAATILPKAINSMVIRIFFFYVGSVVLFALALPYNAYSSEVSPLRFLLLSHRRASRGRHHAGRRPHGRRLVLRARSRW